MNPLLASSTAVPFLTSWCNEQRCLRRNPAASWVQMDFPDHLHPRVARLRLPVRQNVQWMHSLTATQANLSFLAAGSENQPKTAKRWPMHCQKPSLRVRRSTSARRVRSD